MSTPANPRTYYVYFCAALQYVDGDLACHGARGCSQRQREEWPSSFGCKLRGCLSLPQVFGPP
eukprot:8588777-Pyramimonas_sp.AAC.1